MGVLQRFERRLEGMVGLAFARIFKGKVHPAEIAKALTREADEQRSIMGENRILAPNVYVVKLGETDFEHLAQWSDQLAGELADMVAEHIDDEGYQVFDKVIVRLEQDDDLPTGVFEVSSQVADPARPASRDDLAVAAPPVNGHPPLPPLPPLRGRIATDTGKQGPSFSGRAGSRPGGSRPGRRSTGPAGRCRRRPGHAAGAAAGAGGGRSSDRRRAGRRRLPRAGPVAPPGRRPGS